MELVARGVLSMKAPSLATSIIPFSVDSSPHRNIGSIVVR